MNPVANDVKVFVLTQDLELSARFYTALGWRENWRVDGLAELELASSRLDLQAFYAKQWAENFMLYVDVDDAHAWHAHAQAVIETGEFGAARLRPPARQDYGALVTFVWDPVGVLVQFAQQDT